MPRLNGVGIAAALGISKSQVSRQSRAWGLVGADGLIDQDAFAARRAQELNPLMSREPAPAMPVAAAEAGPSVASANAVRTDLQAQLLRLKLEREAGRQLDAAEVESEIAEAGGVFRAVLGGLPSRLALDLARESDPDQVERVLTGAVNEVLRELEAALGAALETLTSDAEEPEEV